MTRNGQSKSLFILPEAEETVLVGVPKILLVVGNVVPVTGDENEKLPALGAEFVFIIKFIGVKPVEVALGGTTA